MWYETLYDRLIEKALQLISNKVLRSYLDQGKSGVVQSKVLWRLRAIRRKGVCQEIDKDTQGAYNAGETKVSLSSFELQLRTTDTTTKYPACMYA